MTIPIKINGKKYRVKPISELTTAEFITASAIPDCDHVKYIAWQTGRSVDDAFFAVTSKAVENAIGAFPDITKLPRPRHIDYTKTISTIGQRHQVESSGVKGYDLLVFCLAVAVARSNNIDEVTRLRDAYMQQPAYEILPAGFFFYKKYSNGSKPGREFLKKLSSLIKMLRKRKLPVFMS
jgi:hypothetical protein